MPLPRFGRAIDALTPGHPFLGRLVFAAGAVAGALLVLWLSD